MGRDGFWGLRKRNENRRRWTDGTTDRVHRDTPHGTKDRDPGDSYYLKQKDWRGHKGKYRSELTGTIFYMFFCVKSIIINRYTRNHQ